MLDLRTHSEQIRWSNTLNLLINAADAPVNSIAHTKSIWECTITISYFYNNNIWMMYCSQCSTNFIIYFCFEQIGLLIFSGLTKEEVGSPYLSTYLSSSNTKLLVKHDDQRTLNTCRQQYSRRFQFCDDYLIGL